VCVCVFVCVHVRVCVLKWKAFAEASLCESSSLDVQKQHNIHSKLKQQEIVKSQFMIMSHSGIDLDGNTVGRAFTRTMCSDSNSIGITEDGGGSVEFVGSTAAHELGHIFNMDHDSSPSE